jgi:phage terminase large subunit GpA-like protein
LTVSEWADAERVLADDEAEAGPWRTKRTPYLREIMDRLGAYDSAEEIVFMKGTQIGGTECAINALGYWIAHDPGRILVVMPGEDEATDFSRQRVQPMIDLSPAVRDAVGSSRSGRGAAESVHLKEFPGGSAKFVGSNAPAGLRSKPARYVLGDEVDGWAHDSGGEGPPLVLIEKRQATYGGRRKRFYVSTPLIKQTSRIEPRFLAGDQRYYFVPCPHCDHRHRLAWSSFVIPKHADGSYNAEDAHMRCPECQGRIDNHDKLSMLEGGEWRATAPFNGWRRSYHLSSLYSPPGWLTWARIADEFLQCKDDPIALKAFCNTVWGESWDQEDGETVDEAALFKRLREDWGPKVPNGVKIITAGVDVQGDRIEVEIVGWGAGYESWSLEYLVLPGDVTGGEVWEELDAILAREFERDDGRVLKIKAAGVDSGHETQRVYTFCRERLKRRVWAVKGKEGENREIWPLLVSRSKLHNEARFRVVGIETCKRHIFTRLSKSTEPGPGYSHVPEDRGLHWFEMLTAEAMKTRYRRGRKITEWAQIRPRNEALDCRVYAYAVLMGLELAGFDFAAADKQIAKRARRAALDGAARVRQRRRQRQRVHAADPWAGDRGWFD